MEKQIVESVAEQGDLITDLSEFGEKRTADIAALRANIEMWANGFRRRSTSRSAE